MKHTIIRIYEVPGDHYQAVERFQEAIALGREKDFHVKDLIRPTEDRAAKGEEISLKPPAGWLSLLRSQLTGSKR